MVGKLVVFEGITASGKKTHMRLLAERLRNSGFSVTTISFPDYDGDIARLTKRTQFSPFTLALLYAADRSQHQERIKALLEKNEIILCDRYCYSNFAYQSAQGIPLEWLKEIEKNIIKPNLVFFVDIPIEVGIKRVQQASIEDFTKKEIVERLQREREIIEKIRETYLRLSKEDRESKWYIIDGTKDVSETIEEVWKAVKEELKIL